MSAITTPDRRVSPATALPGSQKTVRPQVARGLSVLVVGGSPADEERLTLILETTGCEVGTTRGGPAAVDLAYLLQPDVVILATEPAEIAQLAREILDRAGWRKPFLVALTDRGYEEAARLAHQAGAHLTVERPVNPELLCGLLRRFRSLLAGIEGFDPVI